MKTNHQLQLDVTDALQWGPLLKKEAIAVEASDGVVMLSGIVDSYVKKLQAVDAAKKITGVRALVDKIEVRFVFNGEKSDNEIAVLVLDALKLNHEVPFDDIQVEVEDGHVTLSGKLEWNQQKEAAGKAISGISGIKVLTNDIKIETDSADEIEKKGIERALERNWAMNHHEVQVNVVGNKVTLNGIVHSVYQREEAERMAWNAPGVWTVNNELVIDYNE